jgi:hypothetical protein
MKKTTNIKLKLTIVAFLLLKYLDSSSQIFTDNYTNAANWATIDDITPSFNITAGRMNLNTNYATQWSQQSRARYVRPLNGFLSNSKNFRVDLTFQHTIPTISVGMTILALTSNNSPSFITHNGAAYVCNQNSSITILSGITIGNPNTYNLTLQLKPTNAGNVVAGSCPNSATINFSPNVPVNTIKFLSLVRDENSYRLSLYSNANRDTILFDTIVCTNIAVDSLNFVQHGNHPWAGWGRAMNTWVDDLRIESDYTDTMIEIKCPRRCQDSCNWSLNGNTGVRFRNFIGSINSADFKIRTSNVERMTVEANGNVGIGTANPIEKLHVRDQAILIDATPTGGNTSTGSMRLYSGNNAGNSGFIEFMKLNQQRIGTIGYGVDQLQYQTINDAGHVFQTQAGTNERMRITGDGLVGIGTANPDEKLHVLGNMIIERKSSPPSNQDNALHIEITGSPSIACAVGTGFGAGTVNFKNRYVPGNIPDMTFSADGSTPQLVLKNNGNVGIGTCDPTATLQIIGTGLMNMSAIISDKRFKRNIETIMNANDIILKLTGTRYYFKTDEFKDRNFSLNKQYGFIAQEIETVMPEAVFTGSDGYKAVNYDMVIPVLVESQKSLITENKELKSRNEILSTKILTLEEKFALLEKSLAVLCESGCVGLEKLGAKTTSDVDALYQSIPNPTDDVALINYYLTRVYSDATITVSTQDGKQLQSFKLEPKSGNGSVKVSLGNLSSGTYLYTLVAGERIIDTKRLVILK